MKYLILVLIVFVLKIYSHSGDLKQKYQLEETESIKYNYSGYGGLGAAAYTN